MDTDETRIYFRASFPRQKMFSCRMVPCVIFEDEHLLVVNKPAGWNTHAPSPYAGEGIYDSLRHREPRWASLAILHRLDKETSGVLVFGKTPLANKSLTEQFTERSVRKKYLLLTDREVPPKEFTVKTSLVRIGEKYASRADGEIAETKFTPILDSKFGNSKLKMVAAEPLTGRTHQIRVHAAESGFPILGDTLYGGTASSRVFLHATEISFTHPATNKPVKFFAPVNFDIEPRLALRTANIEPSATNAFR
jgi:RluA family pseudouridine synthase